MPSSCLLNIYVYAQISAALSLDQRGLSLQWSPVIARPTDGPSAESKWLLSAQLNSQHLPPRLTSPADKEAERMEELENREGCCDTLISGHCTHELTVTMVIYTRSSQQAQRTLQKAALTGLISYKKREGGHKQEKGACLRCLEG